MAKVDRNGVRHDGWAAVGEANRNHRGRSGHADKEYERKAKEQGINLSNTLYRRTSGYRHNNVDIDE